MSRTKRKDSIDVIPRSPDFIFLGEVINMKPTKREICRAHRDKKKNSKPGSKAKKYLHKGSKAKLKQSLVVAKDYDNLPHPKEPRSDVWRYN